MKKYSHSYIHGKRINWRSLLIAFTLAAVWIISEQNHYDDVYVAPVEQLPAMKIVEVVPSVEDKIKDFFPRSWKTMIAIAHAESHLDMNAKGYNCYYFKGVATTTPIKGGSKACKVEDRGMAYSVDCFVLQKNYKGQKCPKDVSLEEHLEEVATLSKSQGLEAWSAYNNGSYKKYLK